jgi:hypothetical protein
MSCTEKFKRRKWQNRELRRCCGCLSNPILFFSPIFVCWSYIHTGLHPFFLLRSLLSDSWHLCGSKGEKKNKIKTRQSSKEKKKKSEKNVRLWDPGWWMMTRLEKRTGNLCAPWPSYLFSYEKKKKRIILKPSRMFVFTAVVHHPPSENTRVYHEPFWNPPVQVFTFVESASW